MAHDGDRNGTVRAEAAARAGCVVRAALLVGGIHGPPILDAARATGASASLGVLDLLVSPTTRLSAHWAAVLAEAVPWGVAETVIVGPTPGRDVPPGWRATADAGAYRGPAGAARDVFAEADADDVLLLLEGSRLITGSLAGLIATACDAGTDGVVGALADGSPAGVYALRRRVLDLVPARGFIDLKEQLLSKAVAAGRRVLVRRLEGSAPVATRPGYLAALGLIGEARAIVAPDARVDASATVVGSVVMPGAVVGAGAIVARSVVLEGAEVSDGRRVTDRVLGRGGESTGEARTQGRQRA